MPTLEDQVAEAVELEGKATSGEWRFAQHDNIIVFDEFRTVAAVEAGSRVIGQPRSLHVSEAERDANGYLIAALRNLFPALIADWKRQREDCLTLALRLYGESDDTFAPETIEVMSRWRPVCEQAFKDAALAPKGEKE